MPSDVLHWAIWIISSASSWVGAAIGASFGQSCQKSCAVSPSRVVVGAEGKDLHPVRAGLEAAHHGRSDAQDVVRAQLADLVVELHARPTPTARGRPPRPARGGARTAAARPAGSACGRSRSAVAPSASRGKRTSPNVMPKPRRAILGIIEIEEGVVAHGPDRNTPAGACTRRGIGACTDPRVGACADPHSTSRMLRTRCRWSARAAWSGGRGRT